MQFKKTPIVIGLICFFLLLVATGTPSYTNEPIAPLSAEHTAENTSSEPITTYSRARVIEILADETLEEIGVRKPVQTVRVKINSGPEKNKELVLKHGAAFLITDEKKVRLGQEVVLVKTTTTEESAYQIIDAFRLTPIIGIACIFFVCAIIFAGIRGLTSIFGMFGSIFVITIFLIPSIMQGNDPFLVSLVAAVIIACVSLYVAHGFNKKTTVALISTLLTLFLTAVLAHFFVIFAKLSGGATEETLFLQMGTQTLNLKGLLLGGIIIGTLGVLDDITTAQVATVYELHATNTKLSIRELYKKGITVGREHIASLVNTLVLAYTGAALPLFLLFYRNSREPFWLTLNSEYIAEEIVRTLVGSIGLIFAVPISTYLAARTFGYLKPIIRSHN